MSWLEPTIFEAQVKATYYIAEQNLTVEQLLKLSAKDLTWGDELGANVKEGQFAKILIRLQSEGDSATHAVFTIDRQAISGIQAYVVTKKSAGASIYYSYATDKNNNLIPINNAITDSYATLDWNNKLSGANIHAQYWNVPFISNTETPTKISGNNAKS